MSATPDVFDYARLTAYAGSFADGEALSRSSSGGAAAALSRQFIRSGGVVFGAVYAPDFSCAVYACAETEAQLAPMRGSKYVETAKVILTDAGEISVYDALQRQLAAGRAVLYTGLGCDIAAAYSVCKSRGLPTEKLYTVELICHGPTLQTVHEQYIRALTEKYGAPVTAFTTRGKKPNDETAYIRASFANGKTFTEPFYDSDYGEAFSLCARPGCYHCAFRGTAHPADVALGDCHGLLPGDAGYNPNGVSLLLAQTPRGAELLRTLDPAEFPLVPVDAEKMLRHNPMYFVPRTKAACYDAFREDLAAKGLRAAVSAHLTAKQKLLRSLKIKYFVKRVLPKSAVAKLKQILYK